MEMKNLLEMIMESKALMSLVEGEAMFTTILEADLNQDELEVMADYCSDLDDLSNMIEYGDYRLYEVRHHSYSELAEELEEQGILDIQYIVKDNDYYFDYDQLDRDMYAGGDWSQMAWGEAEDIVNGHNDYTEHLSDELQERIEENDGDDNSLTDDIHDYILENIYDDSYRRNWMEEIVGCSDPEWLARYFDYEVYGRDLVYDGQFYEVSRGFIEITK